MEGSTNGVREELSTTAASDDGLPVFGFPGAEFYIIHITALVCLSVSILVSSGVLIYLLAYNSSGIKFFRRPIGERLTVYLALVDLHFSVTHELDHGYMLAVVDHPPDPVCITMAFFLQTFIVAQAIVVLYTAASAMTLVVLGKKIPLGRYDWHLWALTLGIPIVVGVAGTLVPFLGPSGPW